MGSIKKQRKKFIPPTHPWKRLRLEEESKIKKEYGFKTKEEIWKSEYKLKKFKRQAKKLIAAETKQAVIEKSQLINKLMKYGLANESTKIEDVLNLNSNNLMDRRLQTMGFRNNLSRSIKQARQFISHGHIMIGNKKITSPSYLVLKSEEDKIAFSALSSLASPEHPERFKQEAKDELKKEPKKEKVREERPKRKPVKLRKR